MAGTDSTKAAIFKGGGGAKVQANGYGVFAEGRAELLRLFQTEEARA